MNKMMGMSEEGTRWFILNPNKEMELKDVKKSCNSQFMYRELSSKSLLKKLKFLILRKVIHDDIKNTKEKCLEMRIWQEKNEFQTRKHWGVSLGNLIARG